MVGVAIPQAILQNGLINGLMNQMEVMINEIPEDRLPVMMISQLMSINTNLDKDNVDILIIQMLMV